MSAVVALQTDLDATNAALAALTTRVTNNEAAIMALATRLGVDETTLESLLPATPTASTTQSNLLFASGFGASVSLPPPSNFYGTGAWQDIVGTDNLTGFSWPPNWGGGPTHFQLIANTLVDPTTIGNYMVNQIQTVTGHNGTPTQALYSEIKQTPGGWIQDPLMFQPTSEVGDLYISYWLKHQPDFADGMGVGQVGTGDRKSTRLNSSH